MSIILITLPTFGKVVDKIKAEAAKVIVRSKLLDFSRILGCKPEETSAIIKCIDAKGNFVIELYRGTEKVKEITIEDLMF